MTDSWKSALVSEVRVGHVVRTPSGQVVTVCPQLVEGQIDIQATGS